MKTLILLSLILLASCDTVTRRASDDKIESVRVIYSETGGVAGFVTGESSTCTVISSKDNPVEIEEMIFDASANTCTATVKSKQED
jgi:hypothetical protein